MTTVTPPTPDKALQLLWQAIQIQLLDPQRAKLLASFAWDAAMQQGWMMRQHRAMHTYYDY